MLQDLNCTMTGPNLHLDITLGCLFVGTLFSLILYGYTSAQTLYYFKRYPGDNVFTRVLVAILCLLNTAYNIINAQFLWYHLVQHHGNIRGYMQLVGSFEAYQVIASVTGFLVQCFFINTIWRLSADRWQRLPLSALRSHCVQCR